MSTAQTLPGGSGLDQVSTTLPDLEAGRVYHYRLVAENSTGASSGDDRVFVAGSAPGSDAYRDAVLATAGLADYWRLGELSGTTSGDETSATTGTLAGRYVLGQPGVLGPLRNTAASFDGVGAELAINGSALGADATVEGWFRWRSGRTVLRDNTGPSRGWMPALAGGTDQAFLTYRVGGEGFNTGEPIESVRDGDWHHIVATKNGSSVALYVDGAAGALGDECPDRRGPSGQPLARDAERHESRLFGRRGRRARPLHARAHRSRGRCPPRPGSGPRRRPAAKLAFGWWRPAGQRPAGGWIRAGRRRARRHARRQRARRHHRADPPGRSRVRPA